MQTNSGSSFFSKPPSTTSNSKGTPLLMNIQEKNTNLKNKNLEYMVNIRRSNRKDIIRNNRFKNVMKITGQETEQKEMVITSDGMVQVQSNLTPSGFPPGLSHLEKVKDAQRINKMLQEIENVEPNPDNLKGYIELIKNGDRLQKHQAIIYLRKLLSNQQNLPIQETIDFNGVPLLIELAKDTSELHLRLEATWCLANLVSGTTQQTLGLINKNIIQLFEQILDDPYNQIVEQAIWGLGNIIGDSIELRQLVVKSNVLNKLIFILNQNRGMNIQKHIIWCLSNALRIRPRKEPYVAMKNPVMALILAFKTYNDPEIKRDCLFGMSEFCKTNLLTLFTEEKFMESLRQFYQSLYENNNDYQVIKSEVSAIHKIIGNITNGDDFDTDKIINQGFLKDLCVLLCVEDDMCKREICWILSNIAAGTSCQIGSLLNEPNLFDNLVNLLYKSKKEIQREALWAICNMTKNCNKDQLNYLIQNNIFGVFKEFLGMDKDMKMIVLILEAIPNMLDKSMVQNSPEGNKSPLIDIMYDCGVADIISELQRHENDIVYEKSLIILENYFELEEY
jgi:hypothetical protein